MRLRTSLVLIARSTLTVASRCTVAVALTIVLAACAATKYYGGVDTYRGAAAPAPLPHQDRIAVTLNTSEANPLFASEVKAKIESLLRAAGYRIASIDSADFVLLNAYGIGAPQTVSTGGVVIPLRNMIVYTPTSSTAYFRWLLLAVAPVASLRAAAATGAAVEWSWVGAVTSSGSSGDLRLVIDPLLVAAFEHFPTSTGRQVEFTLSERDARIKLLRAR